MAVNSRNPAWEAYFVGAGALSNLTSLDLHINNIASSIPASFKSLTNLTYLDLSDNKLTGAIPASLLNISTLRQAYFHNNNLSSLPPLSGATMHSMSALTKQLQISVVEGIVRSRKPSRLPNAWVTGKRRWPCEQCDRGDIREGQSNQWKASYTDCLWLEKSMAICLMCRNAFTAAMVWHQQQQHRGAIGWHPLQLLPKTASAANFQEQVLWWVSGINKVPGYEAASCSIFWNSLAQPR